jgi:hypothetical protein
MRGAGRTRKHKLFNIACDMTVNGPKSKPYIDKLPKIPQRDEDGNMLPPSDCVFLPDDFPKNMTAEELYEKLDKEKKCSSCGGTGVKGKGQQQQGQGSGGQKNKNQNQKGQGQSGHGTGGNQPCPKCNGTGHQSGAGGIDGDVLDDHDIWDGSTVSEDEARQVVKDMVNQASIRAGNTPGHLIEAIKALEDPIVNWKYELRGYIGREIGSKRSTYSRMNRRRQEFGVKGHSHHASVPLLVMVDTSGSITTEMLQQWFAELEAMSMRFKVTLMQFDHGYQCHSKYHRGDWRKIEVKGRGGTSFIEALKAAEEKRLVGRVNIILTDGEAEWPKQPKYPVLWVILRHPSRDIKPPFGTTIYIDE